MRRDTLESQDSGPFQAKADEHWIQTIFVGVLLLLGTVSNAQETRLLQKPRIDALGSPPFFAKMSSISPSLDIHHNSPSSLGRTQIAAIPPITYFEFRPSFNRLHGSSAFVRSRFATIPELLSKDKMWKGGEPTYGDTDPYANTHLKGMEQYIRHVPMAGPILGRICRQAKAHPNFTRALSMFRPDF
jgi:hypothetical protein